MSKEKPTKVHISRVTIDDLREIGIQPEQIALLSADDLITITHNILLHFNHDVFPHELKWQVHELLGECEDEQKD